MKKIEVSILILVHNAPKYVEETLKTLNEITDKKDLDNAEIIVLDNASEKETKDLLNRLKSKNYIDKLFFSEENTFFAKGNNIAASLASSSHYLLLLNSDIRINKSDWLRNLIEAKELGGYGIAAYGFCEKPSRADGYCFLIDHSLYSKYLLDESYQWWWGLTKLQASVLRDGFSILAIDNHDDIVYHYGGKSGKSFKDARGMDTDLNEIIYWFKESKGRVVVKSQSRIQGVKKSIKNGLKKIYRFFMKK